MKLNSHRKLDVGLWVSGNGECVCVCACVFHSSLCSCCSGQITNESIATLKRMEDGFYLFLKYYVMPISCFLWKWWMCSFPAVPKDPDSLTPPTSLFVTQHFISVVSAYEHQANHLPHSVEIRRFFENSDIASFWRFWAFNASFRQAWLCAAICVQYPLEDAMT